MDRAHRSFAKVREAQCAGPVFGKEDGETISKSFETDEVYLSREISSSLIISFR